TRLLSRALFLRAVRHAGRRSARPARPGPGAGPRRGGAPMTVRIYVPRDAAALALGAEAVAETLHREIAGRGLDVKIVRNGSRGLHWLEPLVEVETPAGRVAYGPVSAADV